MQPQPRVIFVQDTILVYLYASIDSHAGSPKTTELELYYCTLRRPVVLEKKKSLYFQNEKVIPVLYLFSKCDVAESTFGFVGNTQQLSVY